MNGRKYSHVAATESMSLWKDSILKNAFFYSIVLSSFSEAELEKCSSGDSSEAARMEALQRENLELKEKLAKAKELVQSLAKDRFQVSLWSEALNQKSKQLSS